VGRRHFVYYRIDEVDLPDALRAARAGLAALRRTHPGLHAELLRRPDVAAGRVTVMETYAAEGAGIDAALAASIEAHMGAVVGPWVRGGRHVERFDTLGD
jgi:hypothetical protein